MDAKLGAHGLLPRVRSSSTPNQDPRPLIAGATAHITGPRAKTAADILVEEGLHLLLLCYQQPRRPTLFMMWQDLQLKRIMEVNA